MLGALIIDNNVIDKVGDLLRGEDFYNAAHRLISEHMPDMRRTIYPGARSDSGAMHRHV